MREFWIAQGVPARIDELGFERWGWPAAGISTANRNVFSPRTRRAPGCSRELDWPQRTQRSQRGMGGVAGPAVLSGRDREGSGGILPPGKRRAAGSRPSRQTPFCFDPRPLRFSRFQMEICRMNRFGRLLEEKIRKNGQKSLKMSPKSGFQAILRLEARVPAGGVPEGRSSMIQIVSICVAVILCSRRDRACSDWDRKRSQQAAPLHRSNAQNGKNSPDGSGSRSNLD